MASTIHVNSASSSKVVMLMSMEGERFEVEDSVARESKIINHMIEDDCSNNILPIPNVESSIFSRVIEWCKKHTQMEDDNNNEEEEEELRSWADLDTDTLYDLSWEPTALTLSTCWTSPADRDYLDIRIQGLHPLQCYRTPPQRGGGTQAQGRFGSRHSLLSSMVANYLDIKNLTIKNDFTCRGRRINQEG